jgi:subtilisin family serine protease
VSETARSAGGGIRVAIIDSGVHAQHPHVNGVAGGVAIDPDGRQHDDYIDRLGHGTAVTAAIRDLAPAAELFAVKIFDRRLSTSLGPLVAAIEWAAANRMHLVNLSLGTPRREHEAALRAAIDVATAAGTLIVAAHDDEGVPYLPGCLPGVVPVQVDWTCARHECRVVITPGTPSPRSVSVIRASGLPREIPGVPPSRNLHGVSFAVANATGLVARALEGVGGRSAAAVMRLLADQQDTHR